MISSNESKTARWLLNWSQYDVARAAGVDLHLMMDFEVGREIPDEDRVKIKQALEAAGVEFAPDGVRMRARENSFVGRS